MNNVNAVLAGSIEDKWIEFVAAEFADTRTRRQAAQRRAAACVRRVEVQASYLWLFAGALLAWWLC
jgi:hypothetical protein